MDLTIILIILGVLAIVCVFLYNRLIALRQKRKSAFADIDVQLKQRYDLIPNLIETVKGYAAHEKGLLEEVTQARSNAMQATSVEDRAKAEGVLGAATMKLFAVAENYPDLKANQNFLSLQAELSDIENKIAAARRFFNNATSEYNTAIEQFPGLLIARMFNFPSEGFFEIPAEDQASHSQPPKVSFQ